MKTSIIMTSYNYEKFIAQAIESIIAQTVETWELIIVDDGSKDKSLEIINDYCLRDERIKLFTHPNNQNKGLVESIKLGLRQAQYEWVAFLESDDFWENNYLEEKQKFIEQNPSCKLVYNTVTCFGSEKKIKSISSYLENLDKFWDNTTKDVFNDFGTINIVPTFSCVMCKKNTILNCNFNTPCDTVLDYWIWWQIAENNNFGFLHIPLTNWRFHESSYFSKSIKSFKHHMQRAKFINKITSIFKRKPKLSMQNKMEKNVFLAICIYLCIYIRRIIPYFIKKITYNT